jgi:hypothetical protein
MKIRQIVTAIVVTVGLSLTISGLHAEDKKVKKQVIGTNKKTGGEAPGDREKMEDIQKKSKELKEKKDKEKRERQKKKKGKKTPTNK